MLILCFFGTRTLESIVEHLPDSEEIRKRIYNQITKLLEGYLSEANKQIKSTSNLFGVQNSKGVLIILNENIKILSPEIIVKRIYERTSEKKNGILRFGNIDYVLLITNTHAYNGSFISGIIDCKEKEYECLKTVGFLNYIMDEWSIYCQGIPALKAEPETIFKLAETKNLSSEETIYTKRSLWYKTNRYMRLWTDSEILKELEKVYCKSLIPTNQNNQQIKLIFNDLVDESDLRNLNLSFLNKYNKNNR